MTIKDRGIPKPYGATTALATPPCDPCGAIVGTCQDVFSIPNATVVTSFTFTPYGGESTVIAIPASVGYEAVRKAIAAELLKNYEQNVFITATPGSTNFALTHDGYGEITAINAIARTARNCNVAQSCVYKFNYAPDVNPANDVFTNGLTNTNLAAFVDAAALVALLQPLVSATGVVTAVYDASNSVYEIEIADLSPQTYKLNGAGFLQCKCKDIFVA
jgi:phage terminase large subunit-like protein